MNPESAVVRSIEISASASAVWRALTESDTIARWMIGARVESAWEAGAGITFTGELNGKLYRDHGTILAIEREKLLRYSHWAQFSQLPDLPEHRTLVTLSIEPVGDGARLTVRHEHFNRDAEYGHANFFWGYALRDLKALAEETGVLRR